MQTSKTKLSGFNNYVHSWLDDHEVIKFLVCILTVTLFSTGVHFASYTPIPLTVMLASIFGSFGVFASRFYYIKRGRRVPTK